MDAINAITDEEIQEVIKETKNVTTPRKNTFIVLVEDGVEKNYSLGIVSKKENDNFPFPGKKITHVGNLQFGVDKLKVEYDKNGVEEFKMEDKDPTEEGYLSPRVFCAKKGESIFILREGMLLSNLEKTPEEKKIETLRIQLSKENHKEYSRRIVTIK